MSISLDSPEAFEEMIWRRFWPRHYREDRILPWARCDDPAFVRFLRNHMRKIISLRREDVVNGKVRYLSKNNGNIARLAPLSRAFDDALLIVPFRDPIQHAGSLLRQHQRFCEIHQRDPFARSYMGGIGHYDFGLNLKPINFRGWLDRASTDDPARLSFWLEYWIAAYEVALEQSGNRVRLISYDDLCADPQGRFPALASLLGLDDQGAWAEALEQLHPPSQRQVDSAGVDPPLIDRARALAEQLAGASIGGYM
jgi:hypothetical protein